MCTIHITTQQHQFRPLEGVRPYYLGRATCTRAHLKSIPFSSIPRFLLGIYTVTRESTARPVPALVEKSRTLPLHALTGTWLVLQERYLPPLPSAQASHPANEPWLYCGSTHMCTPYLCSWREFRLLKSFTALLKACLHDIIIICT